MLRYKFDCILLKLSLKNPLRVKIYRKCVENFILVFFFLLTYNESGTAVSCPSPHGAIPQKNGRFCKRFTYTIINPCIKKKKVYFCRKIDLI